MDFPSTRAFRALGVADDFRCRRCMMEGRVDVRVREAWRAWMRRELHGEPLRLTNDEDLVVTGFRDDIKVVELSSYLEWELSVRDVEPLTTFVLRRSEEESVRDGPFVLAPSGDAWRMTCTSEFFRGEMFFSLDLTWSQARWDEWVVLLQRCAASLAVARDALKP